MYISYIAFLSLFPLSSASPLTLRTTCSTSNTISDPGFESGVSPSVSTPNPWLVGAFIGSSSYSLTQPGSTLPGGGNYGFNALVRPGPYSSTSGDTLQQTLKTCPGQNYSITADYKFASNAENKCSIGLLYPFKTQVGSVTTGSGIPGVEAGVWQKTSALFQAVTKSDVLKVVFRCEERASNTISVDNFVVKPYKGNAF